MQTKSSCIKTKIKAGVEQGHPKSLNAAKAE